jgi:DNA-binding phage protein
MPEDIQKYLNEIMRTLPSEEMYLESMRDIVKDLIKEYVKKKLNEDPELKKELAKVIEGYLEAKVKEYDSIAKMAKITAKIGFISAPQSVRDTATKDFVETFRKEIEEIILRTL